MVAKTKETKDTKDTKGEPTIETETKPVEKVMNAEVRELAEGLAISGDEVEEDVVDKDEETSEPLSDTPADETNEDELSKEGDETASEDVADEDETDETTPEDTELSELLETDEETDEVKKSGTDKRIDKLTKTNYEKDAKIAELEAKIGEKTTEPEAKSKYTKEQLKTALKKANDEGDTDLQFEIMDALTDMKANEVREQYENKEKAQAEANRKAQLEWTTVVTTYDYLTNKEVELYPDSSTELNITNKESLLYRLSEELYKNHGYGKQESGMTLAVAEALKRIITSKKKSAKPRKTSNEKQLEKKVSKLKRKTSSPSGSKTIKTDKVKKESRPKTNADKVSDEISGRRSSQAWKYGKQ